MKKKYTLPITIKVYTEVEAETLEDACNDIYRGTPDIEGIDLSQIDEWEIDHYNKFEIDGKEVEDSEGNILYLSDIPDHKKY